MRRSFVLIFTGFLLLGWLTSLPAPAQGQNPDKKGKAAKSLPVKLTHPRALEKEVFRLTNGARRKNHLPALLAEGSLTAAARGHSDDMMKREFFDHVNPDGLTPKDRFAKHTVGEAKVGENIFKASRLDPSDVKTMARLMVDGWMTSPGHRSNILNPDYTHLGVGVTVAGPEIRATQLFSTVQGRK
ncbi:MAG: CAP domain-containing protein [Deltaproteobacteria bacterium]|nr:CAP domain-containing protein [Deltaproteobacteria bacterium]